MNLSLHFRDQAERGAFLRAARQAVPEQARLLLPVLSAPVLLALVDGQARDALVAFHAEWASARVA